MRRLCSRSALVLLTASAVLPLGAAHADASPQVSAPLVSGLNGPLQMSFGPNEAIFVAEDFSATLTRISKQGNRSTVATADGEIAGIDARRLGSVVYTTTTGASEESPATGSEIRRALPHGRSELIADLFHYESTHNPDQHQQYGFLGITPDCASQLPPFIPGGGSYLGGIDTHPFSVLAAPRGWWVADAAANDLLYVDRDGTVTTLAVLPPQPVAITAEAQQAFGLPECTVGLTYNAEPVPTDVEQGPDGQLYVSLLAGDPAPGAIYKVSPRTGAFTKVVGDLFGGATNLAITPRGTIYTNELFGGPDGSGQVLKIAKGASSAVPFVSVPSPAALEWHNGKLYASINALGGPDGGQIVAITP